MNTRSSRRGGRGRRDGASDLVTPEFVSWISQTRVARFGLMLIALDDVKSVGEALGTASHRRLLRAVSQRIGRRVRRGHLLELPRAGCFAALVRDPRGIETLAELAERLLQDLRQPWKIDGIAVQATASVGLCMFPEDGESLLMLLHRADLALERARRAGGDRYELYDRALNRRLRDRWDVGTRLWRAVKRKEFSLAYQPLVSAASGLVTGAEALLRWNDPERGPQSPQEFVPLLEHSQLIVPVGEWVLRTACTQAARWLKDGLGRARIAVNLSPRQFEQADLAGKVAGILRDTGLPPELLVLEITENQLMRNPAQARLAVQALHQMGVCVFIDDFGTGYSSITYLKALPVRGIKIDRSFVAGLPHDRNDVLLTEMIIGLGRMLGLEVVAEGVETEAQAAFLRGRSVHDLQGYLLGRPMSEPEFVELLASTRPLRSRALALTAPHSVLQ